LIREIITYLSERPTLKEAKSFGHLVESISLLSRAQRCKKSWATHRTSCKQFITAELKNASHFDSVLVLGSGPLHEIPIELLAKTFKRVVLVDIVHLKSIKKSVAYLKNVEFIEHEITEVEEALRINKQLKNKVPTKFLDQDWGLVLSVNVMSQLPLHFATFIGKKLKNNFSFTEIEKFLKEITKNHLAYLHSFKSNVILITDTQTFYYDKNEFIIQTDNNYEHLSLPEPIEEWNWNVAPIPEFQKDIGFKMRVCGFVLKNINSH
jgi:hypothetical protein